MLGLVSHLHIRIINRRAAALLLLQLQLLQAFLVLRSSLVEVFLAVLFDGLLVLLMEMSRV